MNREKIFFNVIIVVKKNKKIVEDMVFNKEAIMRNNKQSNMD